ncbi:hypothetical protein P7K49_018325 [Saguinus oedipus]|uniref:Uncharacterized protein n=1 Tax=Saguinus oedipus TaxID=9490 RepID=A0ABQ9V688_SAGOE|nr:hypothetical protein P7K49_018325 [Saguinus oedipus]
MLSRSRCVSRAFSRSLSAFQKETAGGRTGDLEGTRAPRAPGRGGRAGWAARGCARRPLPSPGNPRRTFPALPHPPRGS